MTDYTDEQIAVLNADRNARVEIGQQLEQLLSEWDSLDDEQRREFVRHIAHNALC